MANIYELGNNQFKFQEGETRIMNFQGIINTEAYRDLGCEIANGGCHDSEKDSCS
jgi:hypothetical protein